MSGRRQPLYVMANWDADAGVWVATSRRLPGLVTEAASIELLRERLASIIPDLLEVRRSLGCPDIGIEDGGEIPVLIRPTVKTSVFTVPYDRTLAAAKP